MMAEADRAVEGIPAFPLAAFSLPCLSSAVFLANRFYRHRDSDPQVPPEGGTASQPPKRTEGVQTEYLHFNPCLPFGTQESIGSGAFSLPKPE
jgi:hypothetical protein